MEIALMFLKSLPVLLLAFLCWPFTLGVALGVKRHTDRYIIGFAAMQALFFIIYIPAILFGWSTRTLSITAAAVITVAGVAGTLIRYFTSDNKQEIFRVNKPDPKFFKNPYFIISMVIIIYEILIYVVKEPYIYGDDITYIPLITNMVDSNHIYTVKWAGAAPIPLSRVNFKFVFTSYYPFLGMLSVLSGLHPLILCKTVIPLIYLPTHYLIVWRIGNFLFGKDENEERRAEKQSMYFFFYTLLIEFGQISYYTLSRRVTMWIYNSKSDCFCLLLLPLFFYTYLFLMEEKETESILIHKQGWYRQIILLIIAVACNSASLMGVLMSAMMLVLWYGIAAYKEKKWSFFFKNLWTLVPHLITFVLLVIFTGFSFAG